MTTATLTGIRAGIEAADAAALRVGVEHVHYVTCGLYGDGHPYVTLRVHDGAEALTAVKAVADAPHNYVVTEQGAPFAAWTLRIDDVDVQVWTSPFCSLCEDAPGVYRAHLDVVPALLCPDCAVLADGNLDDHDDLAAAEAAIAAREVSADTAAYGPQGKHECDFPGCTWTIVGPTGPDESGLTMADEIAEHERTHEVTP